MTNPKSVYDGKIVVVTGATGLVGMHLVPRLLNAGAKVISLAMNPPVATNLGYEVADVEFAAVDLRFPGSASRYVCGADYVFHLAGIKGSTGIGRALGHTFYTDTILMNTHVLEAAYNWEVPVLYTSSIAVYPPLQRRCEVHDTILGNPHSADIFAATAKRAGEVQLEAMRSDFDDWLVVRPANIYGPYDNFDPETAMVVGALIGRIEAGESPLEVWGNGRAVRDFIMADDVANAMVMLMANENLRPGIFNVGAGEGSTIKTLVNTMSRLWDDVTDVRWKSGAPTGQHYKVLDTKPIRTQTNWKPWFSLKDGLRVTRQWYQDWGVHVRGTRYNPFQGDGYHAD